MKTLKIKTKEGYEHNIQLNETDIITIDSNVVIVETENREFKRGDILYSQKTNTFVIFDKYDDMSKNSFTVIYKSKLDWIDSWVSNRFRHATESEKQLLFDALAKENKQWNPETMQIEELKYIPKVGDCVELNRDGHIEYCVWGKFENVICGKRVTSRGCTYNLNVFHAIKITPDQLQAKYAELGYFYDFENDTVSNLRWKPKKNEAYWFINSSFREINETRFQRTIDIERYEAGNCFKTESECKEAINKIKEVLKNL